MIYYRLCQQAHHRDLRTARKWNAHLPLSFVQLKAYTLQIQCIHVRSSNHKKGFGTPFQDPAIICRSYKRPWSSSIFHKCGLLHFQEVLYPCRLWWSNLFSFRHCGHRLFLSGLLPQSHHHFRTLYPPWRKEGSIMLFSALCFHKPSKIQRIKIGYSSLLRLYTRLLSV